MRLGFLLCLSTLGLATLAKAGPTGLNVIPTTDIVPVNSWILAIQNANTNISNSGETVFDQPLFTAQTQYGLTSWLETGLDYEQTPDIGHDAVVYNLKALLHAEDDYTPNFAVGLWNVTRGQAPGYYVTASKTLNYEQEQEERFRAHHRRNRKLLGRRLHLGMFVNGRGILQPFAGTDLQLNETTVFQADWVQGAGNSFSAGLAYVLSDQRTVINPALLISNDGSRFNGISINFSHQFNL